MPNSGSGMSPWWQYGKPKCRPFFGAWSKRSLGTSSPSQSRACVAKYSSFVTGCQSKPTLLRTPCAKYSKPLPSALMREMLACVSGGMQMLHGAPMLK